MHFRAAALAVVLLAACGKSPAPSAKPSPSVVVPAKAPDTEARARAEMEPFANRLVECLGWPGSDSDAVIWESECLTAKPVIEVVDHVPPIHLRRYLHSPALMLSASLSVTHEGAWFRPELALIERERAVVTGSFFTNDPGFSLPAAATLSLAPDGKIAAARIWFDQHRASHQFFRVAPEREKRKPRVILSTAGAREPRPPLLEQFAAASRRDDPTALAALYAEDAIFRDESAGTGTVGALNAARLFGVKQDTVVQDGWAVGEFVVAELRRPSKASVESTLEILEVRRGRISQHLSFRNGAHADAESTLRLAARPGTAPILRADRLTLLGGQPRFAKDPATTPDPVKRHGYQFHREPIPVDADLGQRLTATLAVGDSVVPFFGEKRCGGFHPDYALLWDVSGKTYEALLCFGCGELKWIAPGGKTTRYDLAHWAHVSLVSALYDRKFR
jgi:hypothetical protein